MTTPPLPTPNPDPALETRLRDTLAPFRTPELPAGLRASALERGARLRRRRRVARAVAPLAAAALLAGTAVAVVTGLDRRGGPVAEDPSGWRLAAASPLSPRVDATVVALGDDVLVLGGSSTLPCPPNASCTRPESSRFARDGAVYDPGANRWRRIADAPLPLVWPWLGVVEAGERGRVVYVLTRLDLARPAPGTPSSSRLLAYSPADDTWRTYPGPAAADGLAALSDGRVLAYSSERRAGARDALFDPATGRWTPVAEDPWPGTTSRVVLPLENGDAVLVAHVGPTGGDVRAARYDAASGLWRALPGLASSREEQAGRWAVVNGQVVNVPDRVAGSRPPLGGGPQADQGGGRTAILDPDAGTWTALPTPQFEVGDDEIDGDAPQASDPSVGAGLLVTRYGVLDVATRRWTALPRLPGEATLQYAGRAVTDEGVLVRFRGWRELPGVVDRRDAALSADLWLRRLP